jgi:hypothetical protein
VAAGNASDTGWVTCPHFLEQVAAEVYPVQVPRTAVRLLSCDDVGGRLGAGWAFRLFVSKIGKGESE